jgi:ketosteroid isomerase-like protein
MASANLALVRSIYAAWERGDYSSVEWAHPEIEFVIADGPSPGRWMGLAGLAEGDRTILDAWEELRTEAEGYHELEGERVLVLIHLSGRGKASGLELGQMQPNAAGIFQLRDGKVTKLALYWDRERAFADLGLAPDGDAADVPD